MTAPLTEKQILSLHRAEAKALLRTSKREQCRCELGEWRSSSGPVCAIGLIASHLLATNRLSEPFQFGHEAVQAVNKFLGSTNLVSEIEHANDNMELTFAQIANQIILD